MILRSVPVIQTVLMVALVLAITNSEILTARMVFGNPIKIVSKTMNLSLSNVETNVQLRVLFAQTLATDRPLALINVEKRNKVVFIDARVTLAAIILKILSVSRHLWINAKLCGEMRLKDVRKIKKLSVKSVLTNVLMRFVKIGVTRNIIITI